MEINFEQLLLIGITTGVSSACATLSSFFIMRYLPGFWTRVENFARAVAKDAKSENPKLVKPEG